MTAKDLLYKVLEYNCMWTLPDRINSKPLQIRLTNIEKLLGAFGRSKKYINPFIQIKYSFTGNKEKLDRAKHLNKLTNFEYFLQGEFLNDRQQGAYKDLS